MTQINHIRDLAKSGYSISEIHELTKTDRKTIVKYLEKDDFSPKPPIAEQKASLLDPFRDKIAEYLEEDKKHWSKQRHTAKRIHDRLTKEEGFTGSYDIRMAWAGWPQLAGITPAEAPCQHRKQNFRWVHALLSMPRSEIAEFPIRKQGKVFPIWGCGKLIDETHPSA